MGFHGQSHAGDVADIQPRFDTLVGMQPTNAPRSWLRAGMVGMGMIFDETYRPFFEPLHARRPLPQGLRPTSRSSSPPSPAAPAARAGLQRARGRPDRATSPASREPDSVAACLDAGVDFVCVATPDDRHFAAAKQALEAGKHVLIEKPSVLARRARRARCARAAEACAGQSRLSQALDPDHKKLRTLVADGVLQHVNNGYCSLLEPKWICGSQFAEWIAGRNPGTYVAVHYIKLIDFTFGGRLKTIVLHRPARPRRPGRRHHLGLDAAADGLRIPRRPRGRLRHPHELGHARQLPRLRRAGSAVPLRQRRLERPLAEARRRVTVEGSTPTSRSTTPNNHYNGTFLEPWGGRTQRGYGIEVLAAVLRGSRVRRVRRRRRATARPARRDARAAYNDLAADRAGRRRRAGDGSDPERMPPTGTRTASCALRLTGG